MKSDYDIIKDKFSEKMAKACRSLFPTILENQGELSSLMLRKFYPNPTIYQDLILGKVDSFKNYIYSFYNFEDPEVETDKNVEELMDEAGYVIYKCHTDDEIASFKKYYQKQEMLCSFRENRLKDYHVFFAVKKDVDNINREDFKVPYREDEYGTSVISLQFSKGDFNTLSIKNRYNHVVSKPDATFENNLENIKPGLTRAFEKEYNLNITRPNKFDLKLLDYILANDGRYYKYTYEFNNVYYCPNNIIINKGTVLKADSSRYKIMDYFLLDYQEKSICLFDPTIDDSFELRNLKKIEVHKDKKTKQSTIDIITDEDKNVSIVTDESNRMVSFKTDALEELPNDFLKYNKYLKNFECPNVLHIGDDVLTENEYLSNLDVSKVKTIGHGFLSNNNFLASLNLPEVIEIGDDFFYYNEMMDQLSLPKCEYIGDDCFTYNNELSNLKLESLKKFGSNFFFYNNKIRKMDMPHLQGFGYAPFGMHMQIYNDLLEMVNNNVRRINSETNTEVEETTNTKHR